MNIFTNYLEKMGNNFLVSAMIPSLALVMVSMLVFNPILKTATLLAPPNGIYQLIGFGLLLTVPTLIVGYTLTALNTYIIKIFEGYVFLYRFPAFRAAQTRKARALLIKRESLKRRIAVVERRKLKYGGKLDAALNRLKRRYFVVAAEYDNNYPPSIEDVLPTKFGNVLKASESYPMSRYGLDGVAFWSRLTHVIPPRYQESIDSSRNELSFLVNISMLSIVFFALCAIAIVFGPVLTKASPAQLLLENWIPYGSAGLIALVNSWLFYKASLYSVGDFGIMIRSAYDLFRLDLLKQFHLKAPVHSADEYQIWDNLNEFIILGEQSLEFVPLLYDLPENKNEK